MVLAIDYQNRSSLAGFDIRARWLRRQRCEPAKGLPALRIGRIQVTLGSGLAVCRGDFDIAIRFVQGVRP